MGKLQMIQKPQFDNNDEPFVDAARAGEFLCLPAKSVLRMARAEQLPAYPLGDSSAKRRQWRFLKSELAAFLRSRSNAASHPHPGSK